MPTEYKLLSVVMSSPGRIFTKVQLSEAVNGEYYENDDSTIMVHISKLREKIEDDPRKPTRLITVRGLGYRFEKNKTKGISSLLARYYLAFTVALILVFGGAYRLWNTYYETLLRSSDVEGMLSSSAFMEGRYQNVNAVKYLGTSGGFSVMGIR